MKHDNTNVKSIPASDGKCPCSIDELMHIIEELISDDGGRLKKAILESSKKRARNKSELLKKQMDIQHEVVVDFHLFERAQATVARRAGKRRMSITICPKGVDINETP